jgi:hypothetical protein
MQLKERQTTDEGSIGTYVVCSPFNGAFFGLNGDRPIDFGSLMLAAFLFHRYLLQRGAICRRFFSCTSSEGLELESDYRNEGRTCNKKTLTDQASEGQ